MSRLRSLRSMGMGLAALLLLGGCAAPGPAEETATVVVVVVHEPLGAPVGGAAVEVDCVVHELGPVTLRTVTQPDGRVRLAVAAPATVLEVRASLAGGPPSREIAVGEDLIPGSFLQTTVAFPVSASGDPGTAAAATELAVGRPGVVEARVVQQYGGAPAAGVPVAARFTPVGADAPFTVTATSGADGLARLTLPSPARLDELWAQPTAATPSAVLHLSAAVHPGAVARYVLRLPPGGSITGRLVGPDGAPLAGLEVLGWERFDIPALHALLSRPVERRTVTDAEGRFRFDGLGKRMALYAEGGGLALPGAASTAPFARQLREIGDLGLVQQRMLRGRVLRTDGSGVAQAGLWVTQSARDEAREKANPAVFWHGVSRYVVTGENGHFLVPVIDWYGGSIRSEHPDFARTGQTFDAGQSEVELRLWSGRQLTGRVLDWRGEPVAASLRMSGRERSRKWTGADGSFSLPLRLEEPADAGVKGAKVYWIEVSAPGCGRDFLEFEAPREEPTSLELRLPQPGAVAVRVVDPDGAPVVGARLHFRRTDAAGAAAPWIRESQRTDALGRFVGEDWPAGPWQVEVRPPFGKHPAVEAEIPAGVESIEVVLDPGRRLAGSGAPAAAPAEASPPPDEPAPTGRASLTVQVVGPDGAPAPGVSLELSARLPGGAFERQDARSTAGGVARFELPAPAHVDFLRALPTADAIPAKLRPNLVLLPGEEAQVELRQPEPTAITGRLVDGDGQPAAGVEVHAWAATPLLPESWFREREPDRRARSDADGRFRIERLSGGITLMTAPGPRRLAGLVHVLPSAGAVALADLELRPVRELRGRVLDADGAPLPGAELNVLTARDLGGGEGWSLLSQPGIQTTDAAGRFAFALPEGMDCRLSVGHPDFLWQFVWPEVADTEVEIRLEAADRLRGRVVDARGAPVAGAEVTLPSSTGTTDADGRFDLAYSRFSWRSGFGTPESMLLKVRAEGHADCAISLGPMPPAPAPLTVTLDPGGALRGRVVDADGAPVAGAMVKVTGPDSLRPLLDALDFEDRTGPLGRFRIDGVPPGRYQLRARRSGPSAPGAPVARGEAEVGGAAVELVIGEG